MGAGPRQSEERGVRPALRLNEELGGSDYNGEPELKPGHWLGACLKSPQTPIASVAEALEPGSARETERTDRSDPPKPMVSGQGDKGPGQPGRAEHWRPKPNCPAGTKAEWRAAENHAEGNKVARSHNNKAMTEARH